jgi:hypothetical protein
LSKYNNFRILLFPGNFGTFFAQNPSEQQQQQKVSAEVTKTHPQEQKGESISLMRRD